LRGEFGKKAAPCRGGGKNDYMMGERGEKEGRDQILSTIYLKNLGEAWKHARGGITGEKGDSQKADEEGGEKAKKRVVRKIREDSKSTGVRRRE